MPTPTYDLIEEKILGSASVTVTFNSIPGTYKDLVLEIIASASDAAHTRITFNGDNSSLYSRTYIDGDGATASSGRASNQTYLELMYMPASTVLMSVHQLQSYANTNVFKTMLTRNSWAGGASSAQVSLYRSVTAVTSITIARATGTFSTNSTFRLWGVAG